MSEPSPEPSIDNPLRREIQTVRGLQSVYDFGGPADAPILHFAHANGFNGLTYRHILAPLVGPFRVRAWDARGHGFCPLPADPKRLHGWTPYRDDLVALIKSFGEPVFLGGHSLGGASSIMAGGLVPELVRGLVLAEPVLPPTALAIGVGIARGLGLGGLNPMARAALRRRREFPDHQTMVEAYIGRGAFKTWPRRLIEDYVSGGAKPVDGGLTLACSPEWEAATFSSLPENLSRAFGRLECPVILLTGAHGSTAPAAMVLQVKLFCRQVDAHRIDGTSHFLPMERPDLIERAAHALLAGQAFMPA
jgi:pimeloyl-ACP methyl ester carboxylesterase